ncbi:MAG: molybdenum cofactor sulfurase [Nitrospirales bacterium]|nr:MAG: molybdenum cofactor sulfurase [Nitrospirales bacterium]
MTHPTASEVGTIASMWRYPVKSMMGEELFVAQVADRGIIGDRSYAILDHADGNIATAKNPRKWPTLFNFQAKFPEVMHETEKASPVHMTLPDGTTLTSELHDIDQQLSQALNRDVMLVATEQGTVKGVQSSLPTSWTAHSEEYWPDVDGRDHRDTVTDFTLPAGTFFDAAMVHILTTATLNRLREGYLDGQFAVPRFRPNLVVETIDETKGFAENAWIGKILAIGDRVRLSITGPCARCVMTTLSQGDLPKDPGILRTALKQNQGNVGVYASVIQGGTIRSGDGIQIEG